MPCAIQAAKSSGWWHAPWYAKEPREAESAAVNAAAGTADHCTPLPSPFPVPFKSDTRASLCTHYSSILIEAKAVVVTTG